MRSKSLKVLLSWMIVLVCIWNCGMNVFAASINEMTKEEWLENYSVDTGNEEADKLFNHFIEKSSGLSAEDKANYFELKYENELAVYCELFVTYANGTEEEWQKKDAFERYLWDTFYITPVDFLTLLTWDELMEGQYSIFKVNIIEGVYVNYSRVDEEWANAYRAVMEWQYNYISENGAVYNFMTGENSLGNTEITEDMGEQVTVEESKEVSESKEESEKETSVVEESKEESKKEASAIEKSEEIGEDTVESVKSYGGIIAILGVFVVALIGVIIYRSKGTSPIEKVGK